jgi:hypothetical protein
VKFKNLFLIFILLSFFIFSKQVFAAACVNDGGPSCLLGAAYDYSTICSDGTIDHGVIFSTITSCQNVIPQYSCPSSFDADDKANMQTTVLTLQASLDNENSADKTVEANLKNGIYPITPAIADTIDKIELSGYPQNQIDYEVNQQKSTARSADQLATDNEYVSTINRIVPLLNADKAIIADCPITATIDTTPSTQPYLTQQQVQVIRAADGLSPSGATQPSPLTIDQITSGNYGNPPPVPKESFWRKIENFISHLKI